MPSAESIKEKNEAFLRQLGLEVNTALPLVESPEETSPKSATDVAQQLVAVSYVVRVGFGYLASSARARLLELGIADILGGLSQDLLAQDSLSEQDKVNMTWQVEGIQSLAWALNLAELDHTRGCDHDLASRLPAQELEQEKAFIANAQLRPLSEIREQVDLIYRMHWACVNARYTGTATSLNESIIRERRRALDWIYGVEEDWDEVPLDT